ncbi:major facilitator superfamily domain-containing protein [Colletotrichum phormii]|uniref:Major facilitator superfamily domain-containing protein n=1 Tax=Colletotrichum phormii TaxID=359342 RepID=A0AAJ0EGB1_9PEZI|nr:major facilitator superfamily domain-containing protein [Colletotrichum phormii]KAK1635876.1 major facilitator superfamily domain-containing protein [Colletotrichum phormii]
MGAQTFGTAVYSLEIPSIYFGITIGLAILISVKASQQTVLIYMRTNPVFNLYVWILSFMFLLDNHLFRLFDMPHLAKLMPNYVTATIALSFEGFLNGFDTGTIGSVVHMKQFATTFGDLSATVRGITVSMILLTGIIPSLLAGQLADKYGRLRIISPGAALFALGALLQTTSFSLGQFILGRAVSGIGQGVFLGNIAVYLAEIAPPVEEVASPPCLSSWQLSASVSDTSLPTRRAPLKIALRGVFQSINTEILILRHPQDPTVRTKFPVKGIPTGTDAITYYAPALFDQAGISQSNSSLIASGVSSITMLVVSIPASILADKWGRRTSAISGGVILSGLMMLMGSLYAAGAVGPTGVARWVVVISVFAFGMAYCATWNVVTSYGTQQWAYEIYASEILPGNTRAAGNSIGMASSFFTNWLVALITPILLSASAYGAYFLFGGLTVITAIVLTVFMPETRGRSLESIQSEFRRPVFTSLMGSLCAPRARHRNPQSQSNPNTPIELLARAPEPSTAAVSSSIAA